MLFYPKIVKLKYIINTTVWKELNIIWLPSHCTHTLPPLDGPLKSHFKNEAAACEITRYHMAPITGHDRSKAVSVGVGVSVLAPMGNYSSNRNRMPEYFFSVSDSSETTTSTETAPPNMAPICVPSISRTNCENVLPNSAKPSISNLSSWFPSDIPPKETTASRLLEMSPVPKIPWKLSISKRYLSFFSLKKLIISRKRERSKDHVK